MNCPLYELICFQGGMKGLSLILRLMKELSFCHKLNYSYPNINSVRSNKLSLKYQRFIPTDCRDIEIRKFEVVTKTQFLKKLKMRCIFSYNLTI